MRRSTTWLTAALLTGLMLLSLPMVDLAVALRGASPSVGGALDTDAIDQIVATHMRAGGIPGGQVAIVHGKQVVYLKGFGVAGPDGRAVTPQTPFILGSTSKAFTALAVMQLVEAGRIDLDAPATTYIPWLRARFAPSSAAITVRHMLNHTSGFTYAQGMAGWDDTDTSDAALTAAMRAYESIQPARAPGAAYEYSNLNYLLLGQIVAAVAGQSYERYVQAHIFTPLEMRHAYTSAADAQSHGLATGYRYWFGRAYPDAGLPYPRRHLPDAFLIASAEDMAHHLIAQLNGGQYGGTRLISADGIDAMQRAAVGTGAPGESYGMGWVSTEYGGEVTVVHGGDVPQFHSDVILWPHEGWGVAVLINANTMIGDARPQIVGLAPAIMAHIAGKPLLPPIPAKRTTYVSALAVLIVLSIMQIGRAAWWCVRRRTRTGTARGWRLALALLADILLAALLLVGVPWLQGMPLAAFQLFVPDIAWPAAGLAIISLVWAGFRTIFCIDRRTREG